MSLEMGQYTHVVAVMKDHYPSMFLFKSEAEARAKYDEIQIEAEECDDFAVFITEVTGVKGQFWTEQVEWY